MQGKKAKILSVIVPAYNVEDCLENCLESLLQTKQREKTEILVINDGSKDSTGEIIDSYAARYPSIVKAFHKKNGGHGSAINLGIMMSSGSYLKVVDGDDWVDPIAYDAYLYKLSKLAFQKSNLSNLPCDLVVTPFICVREKNGKRKKRKKKVEGTEKFPKEKIIFFQKIADKIHIRMHEWTIRTKILKEHKIVLSEHSFYVDMQYIIFPVPWIQTICILPYPVYCYRLGSQTQSVSIKNMQKNRLQHYMVLQSLVQFYKEQELEGERKEILSYLACGIAKMEANQAQICLSLPIGTSAKSELVSIEKKLQKTCSAAYQANPKYSLWLLRKSNYLLYPIAAVVWRIVKQAK